MNKKVLFICTGNYYRSRFAEAVFNHHAHLRRLPWRAFSRGLAINQVDGDLSPFAFHALMERNIHLHLTSTHRIQLGAYDLQSASLIIALKESEHRTMMINQFPFWTNRITYWEEHDLDVAPAEEALPKIEQKVLALLDQLGQAPIETAAEPNREIPPANVPPAPSLPTKLAGKTPSELNR